MSENTPTYEDLLERRYGSGERYRVWEDLLASLSPGEVREVELRGRRVDSVRSALYMANKKTQVPIITRFRNGKFYLVRLRDEDVPVEKKNGHEGDWASGPPWRCSCGDEFQTHSALSAHVSFRGQANG